MIVTPELKIAQTAAQAAGEIIAKYFASDVGYRMKEAYNIVTVADVEAERKIVETIHSQFPDHAILAEEQYSKAEIADRMWVIDPLDGTNNFAHRVPHFSVSIAYCEFGRPVCGVIYHPLRNEWYVAVRGQGAWFNGQRVHVSETARLDETLVAVGFYYDRGQLMESTLTAIRDLFRQQIHGIRRFGAATLDLVGVALGQYGAYFEYELSPWDFAAGQLFVEEAGGKITTCLGQPLPLTRSSVLATNGHLHQAVLDVVRQHFPSPGKSPFPPT